MKSRVYFGIMLAFFCTFFTSSAQVFLKFASGGIAFTVGGLLANTHLYAALVLYGIGSLLLIYALKVGDLSVVYPVLATSYIWVILLSNVFFGETISFLKLLGIATIFLGVTFIGLGGKR